MDADRFDAWTRRRFGLAAGGLAVALVGRRTTEDAAANKKRKTKLVLNGYGCVDVGKPCRGNDAICCSGLCAGKKPKKGKKDKRKCVAHHVATCRSDQDSCVSAVLCSNEVTCGCHVTTGNAPFCGGQAQMEPCIVCKRDADCVQMGFPAGSACVQAATVTCCANLGTTTACFPPCATA